MNTIRSTWYGWGTLVVAGAGAYIFAKRSVNADRKARHEADMKRRRLSESLEYSSTLQHQTNQRRITDHGGSLSAEANNQPSPTKLAQVQDGEKIRERSKYEASEPFRAKKGDRFS